MPADPCNETIAAIEDHLAKALLLADAAGETLIAALIEDARTAVLARIAKL